MNFKLNEIYNGFRLIREEQIKEVDSVARIFKHEKSGARLLSLENKDDNKAFSISFKTPPKDSTGVAHILEHSVLCGSKKFPTKEPFVELAKGSLNTFLNAMTFSDKTMYPVASKNNKDFFNLMDVYLDCVLFPNIHQIPEIMMQEGWHHHIENIEDEITYKGVVYNEMQGAFASPEGLFMRRLKETVLKDTTYGHISGGDPKYIPDLTHEQFENFHKKFYHPSNSYIYLYGNGDLNEQMKFINEKYLDKFEIEEVDSKIEMQKPYDEIGYFEKKYSILKDEDDKDKTFLSMNFVGPCADDRESILGMEILEYILLDSQAAPLKKALIDAEIGKDVYGVYSSSTLQSVMSFVVKNSNKEKLEQFKQIVNDTLNNIVEKGIDKELIEACMNIREFELREAETGYPKGVYYGINALSGWLHDFDPLIHLKYEEEIESITQKSKNGYFESLIKKYILENKHGSIFVMSPEKGLGERENQEIKDKLKKLKESLSKEELQELVDKTQKLLKKQQTPDTKEALDSIPLLNIEDIPKNPEKIESVEREIDGIKTLHQDIFTGKISYLRMYFDATVIPKEDVQYATLLGSLIGKVDTENKTYAKLSNEININTGGINGSLTCYTKNDDDSVYYPKFTVGTKVLKAKIPNMTELLREIILESKYDDTKRIREIIRKVKSRLEQVIIGRGHQIAVRRLTSYFSPSGKYVESISGMEYYKFICNLEENFDNMKDELVKKLNDCAKRLFNRNGLIINITTEEEEFKALSKEMVKVTEGLERTRASLQEYNFQEENKKEAFKIPGNVQYVAKGYNFKKLGKEYSGKLKVLNKIASMDYLWNKIRVQGGAYACLLSIVKSGTLAFASYRDPNIKETLDAYDGIVEYLRGIELDERELRKYIIGTISGVDAPLSPAEKGFRAFGDYVKGQSYEDYVKEREEILTVTNEDIRAFADMIEAVLNENNYCVVGSEGKLNDNKDMFNSIVNVF